MCVYKLRLLIQEKEKNETKNKIFLKKKQAFGVKFHNVIFC